MLSNATFHPANLVENVFIFHSAVQKFTSTHELIVAEMRVLANDSEFAES